MYRAPLSLHPLQCLLLFVLMMTILTVVGWNLKTVLIYISSMTVGVNTFSDIGDLYLFIMRIAYSVH